MRAKVRQGHTNISVLQRLLKHDFVEQFLRIFHQVYLISIAHKIYDGAKAEICLSEAAARPHSDFLRLHHL
jgi:hypothetical protein